MMGIDEMFAEYTWRQDDYQQALEIVSALRMAAQREYEATPWRRRTKDAARVSWRARNPEAAKEVQRRNTADWRARNPEKFRALRRAQEQRYRDKHRERLRAYWRARKQALRAEARRAA